MLVTDCDRCVDEGDGEMVRMKVGPNGGRSRLICASVCGKGEPESREVSLASSSCKCVGGWACARPLKVSHCPQFMTLVRTGGCSEEMPHRLTSIHTPSPGRN